MASAGTTPALVFTVFAFSAALAALATLPACSRDLNNRSDEERQHAVKTFREDGELELENGRVDKAWGCFSEALRIDNRDAPSLWGLARLYKAIGDAPTAADFAERAIACDPNYAGQELADVPIEDRVAARKLMERREIPKEAQYRVPPRDNQPTPP